MPGIMLDITTIVGKMSLYDLSVFYCFCRPALDTEMFHGRVC